MMQSTSLSRLSLSTLKSELPHEEFVRGLKSEGPIFYSEADRFWVVTDRALALDVLRNESFSADRSSAFLQPRCPFHKVANFFGLVKKMMVNSDAPVHTVRRKLAHQGISDRVVDGFEPRVGTVIQTVFAACVDDLMRGQRVDFVEQIAMPIPNIVLAELFSIPEDERIRFFQRANAMTQFFGGASANIESDAAKANEAAAQLKTYFAELITERRAAPADDFISHLIEHQQGLGLDDDEVIAQSTLMFVAGTVTTSDQMANVLNHLLSVPELWNKLLAGEIAIKTVCEDATRLDPSVSFLFRLSKKDQVLGGKSIRAGELVFISTAACNRDHQTAHLSYGHGSHYCLGARLGRIQIQGVIETLVNTGRRYQIAQSVRKNQSLGFSGFESLIIQARKVAAI